MVPELEDPIQLYSNPLIQLEQDDFREPLMLILSLSI